MGRPRHIDRELYLRLRVVDGLTQAQAAKACGSKATGHGLETVGCRIEREEAESFAAAWKKKRESGA